MAIYAAPPRVTGRPPFLPLLAGGLALVAFAAGQLVGSRGGTAGSSQPAPAVRAPSQQPDRGFLDSSRPPATGVAPSAPGANPTATATGAAVPRATPEITAVATAEAGAQLEALRGYIDERCWPRGGLRSGRPAAALKFNLTFDAEGREIARGIAEDRRAPAGDFTRCLRRLGGTALHIAPRGTTVALTLPVTFP